ncbi:MAG: alpha-L-fucosidase [Oscillospiraceae bacterium]|jgi:alpha-L-fucosidase|nr:alpha-L-fucosidase [Oscillospiraceae bacterium]
MTVNDYLKLVDDVIDRGPYKDTWESLCRHPEPEWYKAAKFGIFIHWGVYSVPAFAHEWYSRTMYIKDSPEYHHHIKTYGKHKDFGYKDFIPMFKAENFDADEWIALIKDSGAKYMMPVAEHHDGFQMYDSDLSKWNASQMGPCRDVIGELKQAAEKNGIVLGLSSHRAEHCWFFNGGLEFESDINDPESEDFYGEQMAGQGDDQVTKNVRLCPPPVWHCENWLARTVEIIEKYRPSVIYFDWWVHNAGFRPYLKKFTAYYYNRALELGFDAAINYKQSAFPPDAAIFDVERGHLDRMRMRLWQTCTASARNSWCHTTNNDYKDPVGLVTNLVDVVSKNGCMLLNIGPKSDGSITDEEKNILRSIGKWLKQNGEGIYGTSCWSIFGEGPTNIKTGEFTDSTSLIYTSEDIRFTYNCGILYAFIMKYPKDGIIKINSLRKDMAIQSLGDSPEVSKVSVLGFDNPVSFTVDEIAMTVQVEGEIQTEYPVCIKINLLD